MFSPQDFYNKLSDAEKKVFYLAVAFVVAALFDLLFLQPVLSRMKHIDEEIGEKRNSIVQDIRYLSYRDRILQERREFERFQTGQNAEEDKIIADFLTTIQAIAADSSVAWTKLNPGGKEQKKGYIEYYAEMECEGKLKDMVKFMYEVDTTDNLLRIVKVNLTAAKASPDSVKANMKVGKLIIDMNTISNYSLSGEDIDVQNEEEIVGDLSQYQSGGGGGGVEMAPGQDDSVGGGGAEGEEQNPEGGGPGGGGGAEGAAQEGETTTQGGGADSGPGGSSEGGSGSGGGGAGAGDGMGIDEKGKGDKPEDQETGRKASKILGVEGEDEESARPKVASIFDLWNDFWGIEPEPEKIDPKKVTADGYPEDYKVKENVWERMLGK